VTTNKVHAVDVAKYLYKPVVGFRDIVNEEQYAL
jgi:hypothetical protein